MEAPLNQAHGSVAEPDVLRTACCVVGAGPAGTVLSLLLARRGIDVALLEAHRDLDRDFRGDTIHPSTLELIDQLGLAERLHAMPHRRLETISIATQSGRVTPVDFRRLNSRFPYMMIMPQGTFLEFLAEEASRFKNFRLLRNANVQELLAETGVVQGVRYQGADSKTHDVRAGLTVACDGRFSRLRKLAGFEVERFAPPMDVLWVRLPRHPDDDPRMLSGVIHIGGGHFGVLFDRPNDEWQIGYAILKGSFAELKSAGIASLQQGLADLVPALADRVNLIDDFKKVTILSVEVSRIRKWHKPGLLLLGDAAHVMSPVGGIGIQYAVQDAVAAANALAAPLQAGPVDEEVLAAIQACREPAVRKAQNFQRVLQQRIVAQALSKKGFRLPLPARVLLSLPVLRGIPTRIIGHGFHPVRLIDS
jgi:2-polyprenyl-6-methoxyphenol hydroxylase-like FAD-dependent oxidoreductase